jgi:PIN domain nuclease of toxin-antitoxin system
MTFRLVADTHTVRWYLYDDPRLSAAASAAMDAADAAGDQIAMSSIALIEMVYLIEKGRIDAGAFERVLAALDRRAATLVEVPLDRAIAQVMRRVDRAEVPDLPDRVIAATALYLRVPLVSRDRKIRMSAQTTIW